MIADKLDISYHTVNFLSVTFVRASLHSVGQAVAKTIKENIV